MSEPKADPANWKAAFESLPSAKVMTMKPTGKYDDRCPKCKVDLIPSEIEDGECIHCGATFESRVWLPEDWGIEREREAYEETLEGRMRELGKAIREILMIDKTRGSVF